ncbi:DUF72 domain-containing protein [Actinacidiphila acidipaludis]|uniref:DUF72 domain-containing protein n=1 Tax=Actinacidiphila acidipaludis TaxID=2873382 RepID=A0ABS7QFI0_9ACTN|nr:DUF72 domain-containing protein [Streptomyces acidipaludis]MBY8881190.1 DUF72 domain-containing protein [Streptomyces acidipaludis]
MGRIRVGTCSWTDRALVGSGWYPPGQRDAEGKLRFYASNFAVAEVDSTYYGLPSERNSRLWVERTPEGFRFDVKAFSLLTGHPTPARALPADLRGELGAGSRYGGGRPGADGSGAARPEVLDEVWRRFAGALEPLRLTRRLGAVLFQFPPWFAPGAAAEASLRETRERTGDCPISVEFRHPAWWLPERRADTAALLTELDATAVAVDMAQRLPSSIPPVAEVTSPRLAVVRLHGRSPAWATGSKEDRFRHDYTPAELAEWVPRVRAMAEGAREVHVLFNNCCADAAVRAAASMARLVPADPLPGPPAAADPPAQDPLPGLPGDTFRQAGLGRQ